MASPYLYIYPKTERWEKGGVRVGTQLRFSLIYPNRAVREKACKSLRHFQPSLLQLWEHALVSGSSWPVWTPSAKTTFWNATHTCCLNNLMVYNTDAYSKATQTHLKIFDCDIMLKLRGLFFHWLFRRLKLSTLQSSYGVRPHGANCRCCRITLSQLRRWLSRQTLSSCWQFPETAPGRCGGGAKKVQVKKKFD